MPVPSWSSLNIGLIPPTVSLSSEHLWPSRANASATVLMTGVFSKISAEAGRFAETFPSWVEHLRQHERVTKADRMIETTVRHFLRCPPVITHLINAEAKRRS